MTADLLQILQFSVVIFLCGKHCTLPYLLTSRLLPHMCMPLLGHCLHICHDVIGIHTCNDSIIIHAEHVVHRRGYCFHFGCMFVCLYVCMYVSALERKRLIGMT